MMIVNLTPLLLPPPAYLDRMREGREDCAHVSPLPAPEAAPAPALEGPALTTAAIAAGTLAQAFFAGMATDSDAVAAARRRRKGWVELVAAAYSTTPVIPPGQFVNIYV